MLSQAMIAEAQAIIAPSLHRTPLVSSHEIGHMIAPQVDLWLKAEHLQKTGSFKPRGVLNCLAHLEPQQRQRGVLTITTGNTGQALAWAAAREQVPCTVIMPAVGTSHVKIEAARRYGAQVICTGANLNDCQQLADHLIGEQGLTPIQAYDDLHLIAGHATIGNEILQDCPFVSAVLVPVGGGALAAGIAVAIKKQHPDVAVYGVEPACAPRLTRALASGKPVDVDPSATIADGLRTPHIGEQPFPLLSRYLDDVVLVSEQALKTAILWLLTRAKFVVEPAGAITVAALLEGRVPLRGGERIVAILSGGNIDPANLSALCQVDLPPAQSR
jgi:threonine dehydratase